MIYNVYALFDKDLNSFSGINAFQNDIVVNRYYENILNNSGSDNFLFKHQDKFAIYQLAEFDLDKGTFKNLDNPRKAFELKDVCVLKNEVYTSGYVDKKLNK